MYVCKVQVVILFSEQQGQGGIRKHRSFGVVQWAYGEKVGSILGDVVLEVLATEFTEPETLITLVYVATWHRFIADDIRHKNISYPVSFDG